MPKVHIVYVFHLEVNYFASVFLLSGFTHFERVVIYSVSNYCALFLLPSQNKSALLHKLFI